MYLWTSFYMAVRYHCYFLHIQRTYPQLIFTFLVIGTRATTRGLRLFLHLLWLFQCSLHYYFFHYMCRVAPLPQEIAVVFLAAAQIVWNSRKTSSTQINMKNEKFDKTAKFHLIMNHLKNRLQYQFSPFRIARLLVFRMQPLVYLSNPSKIISHMYSAFSIRSCASYMCNSQIIYHVIKKRYSCNLTMA